MNSLSIIDPAEKATSLSNMSSQVPLFQEHMAAMGDIFSEKTKVFISIPLVLIFLQIRNYRLG